MNIADIQDRFAALRVTGQRHKDAAEALGISEGEAVAAHADMATGDERSLRARPLRGPWLELLQSLERCGPMLALTRNASTVHEKTGVYRNLSGSGPMGLALGEEIDLRLFFSRWHAGFAVSEGASMSLQFFDAHGVAVHKIFAREATDREAFRSVIDDHAGMARVAMFTPALPKAAPREDDVIDTTALHAAWGAMQDTHEFFGLLNTFDVERQQSFCLTEGTFTRRADRSAVRRLLDEAAFDGMPIMVFVGSPGCIQIHTGPVVRVEPMTMGGVRWLNVLDPSFNLHLREDLIDAVWIVEKPTRDGTVTSVEVFDRDGGLMAMFFGARKPGVPERDAWRAIVQRLPPTATETGA